jgi:thiol-disulfide isomerase/thioredoxin
MILMKLTPTYSPLTIATLMAGLLTTSIGINTISAASLPAISQSSNQLIAMGSTTALAKELQGKPVVVDVYASWCPACKNVAPTLSQLKQQYGNKANFVVLDVTDRQATAATMKLASKNGLSKFLNANKSQTGTIAIIDPATGKVIKQFRNNATLSDYTAVLDRSIAKMGKGDAMKKP